MRTAEARCVRFEELEDTEHAEMYPELTPQVTEVLRRRVDALPRRLR